MAIINHVAMNLAYEFYLAGMDDGERKKTIDEHWSGLSDYFKAGYLMQAVWVFENYIEPVRKKRPIWCKLLPPARIEAKHGKKKGI